MIVRFSSATALIPSLLVAAGVSLVACSSSDSPVGTADDGSQAADSDDESDEGSGEGNDEGAEGEGMATEAAAWVGDGTLESVELVQVYDAPDDFFCTSSGCRVGLAVDLEFNPARPDELWVLYRQPYDGAPCEESTRTVACELLSSKVAIISEADTNSPDVSVLDDGNSWHFMRVATALAFADDDTFATVGEARTGNWMDHPADFMGPTWWSSDPAIFAVDFGLNGSHLDMLHATPFGMGIAHDPTMWEVEAGEFETQPVFWAFNGDAGAIDRYDFKEPHTPGGEDHSDGTMHRYVDGQLKMAPGIPSHMEFASLGRVPAQEGLFGPVFSHEGDMADLWLYIADTGNQRVVRLDTKSGSLGGPVATPDPQLADPRYVEDAVLETVVPRGTLEAPSGVAVAGELLFVSDTATSRIFVFDLEGETLEVLDTELPAWSLAGLAIGPDQKLYFVDWAEGSVYRVEVD